MVRKLNNAEEAGNASPNHSHRALVNLVQFTECMKTLVNIKQPVLLVTAQQDRICLPVIQEAITKPYAEDLRIESLDCAHWVQLEKPEETNELLKSFFEETAAKSKK